MKKHLFFLITILLFSNFIIAQVRVDRNRDYYLADLYTLYRTSPSSSVSRIISNQSKGGPNVGRDTLNHVEQCGIRVIMFLAPNNVGENPRADRTGDLATLRVTMNNIYIHQHPVYEQTSWAAHHYVVVLLDNSVANLTPDQQWAAVWSGTVIATKRYDDSTPIDIKQYINSTNADRITFGIRAEYQNNPVNNPWAATSSSIFGFIGTVLQDEQISVTVKNNFPGGKIKSAVNNSNPPALTAPVTVTDMTRKTLYMGAVEGTNQPMVGGYNYVFNDTEAPLNPSNWYTEFNNVRISNFSSNANTNRTLSSSEKNYSYVADMKKVCNVNFQTTVPGGTITVGGTNYTNSTPQFQVVELNTIAVSVPQSYLNINGLTYTFTNWDDGNTSYSGNMTITANHLPYTANYSIKPTTFNAGLIFGTVLNAPIVVNWTDNVNTAVNKYQIWRRTRVNGVYSNPVMLTEAGRGVQTYTDHDYYLGQWKQGVYLEYGIRTYYSGNGSYSDYVWSPVYANNLAAHVSSNNSSNKQIVEEKAIPENYYVENYPNPFNPTTTINYQLPTDGNVTLKVYDMLGKEVATLVNDHRTAGYYSVGFNASNLPSGIYIYTINANNYTQSKKMILMK